MQFRRGGGGGGEARASDYEWPRSLPAFRTGATFVDPAGRAWVARYGAVGDPVVYDVFDGRGVRTARYELPAGQRVIGITERAVYAVRIDALGLFWLERYAPPG